MSKIGATISVSWGDGVYVSITLAPNEWAAVKAGEPFKTTGVGYYYEGDFFQDYWSLLGGLEGALEVTYDDCGVGFSGRLCDATIVESPIRKAKKKRKAKRK